jgi:hypothetical protein
VDRQLQPAPRPDDPDGATAARRDALILRAEESREPFEPEVALFLFAVDQLANVGTRIRTARAAFQEGGPIYPDSHLFSRSHVQVAVRDPALIVRSWRERRP